MTEDNETKTDSTNKESTEKVFELVKVPTQHELMIQTPEEEVITTEQLIVRMANDIRELVKNLI
jgi:hypothetical protein